MENQRINNTTKSKLSEFNLEEIRGWMIGRMYDIESKIDFVICGFFKPEKKGDFKKIILNSSIISIGGKMKILRNIKHFNKSIIEKIGRYSSIRNAFAHISVKEIITITITNDENGKFKGSEISKITSQIEVMNSSGDLKERNIHDLINEFYKLNDELEEYLMNYKHSQLQFKTYGWGLEFTSESRKTLLKQNPLVVRLN